MATLRSLTNLASSYPEVLLSFFCFIFLFLYNRKRKLRPPTNWPLLGMFPSLAVNIHRFFDWSVELLFTNGCNFEFKGPWFSGMNIFATTDPANINHIFNTNFQNYPKGEEFLEIFDFLGDGIFNADDESWKSQRKAAHSVMSDLKFRRFVVNTTVDKVVNGLLPLLSRAAAEKAPLDLQDVFLRFTFDTTSAVVIGFDPGCLSLGLPSVPFANAIDDAEDVVFFRHAMPMTWWKLMRWLRVGEERRMARACETIRDFMGGLIARKIEDMKNHEEEDSAVGIILMEDKSELLPRGGAPLFSTSATSDIISTFLKTRPELVESGIASKYLFDMALNLILAGRDTTSTALTWFFWLVSQHPEVERKILEELKPIAEAHVGEEKPVIFKAEELSSNVYLLAALHESLRLFPPVPLEHKSPKEADVLPSGHEIKPGEKILVNLYAMARVEGVWGKDCREFVPERWITTRGTLKHEPSYKFMSFNSGPRTCLGKDMAFTQMKVVAATMLHNFRVRVVPGHIVSPKLSIILHMKNGLLVNVEKRD